jgi:hypothetical protein
VAEVRGPPQPTPELRVSSRTTIGEALVAAAETHFGLRFIEHDATNTVTSYRELLADALTIGGALRAWLRRRPGRARHPRRQRIRPRLRHRRRGPGAGAALSAGPCGRRGHLREAVAAHHPGIAPSRCSRPTMSRLLHASAGHPEPAAPCHSLFHTLDILRSGAVSPLTHPVALTLDDAALLQFTSGRPRCRRGRALARQHRRERRGDPDPRGSMRGPATSR